MLPSADRYLKESGLAPKAAAWILIGCFLGGVVGIQVVSRVLHSYMPSEVVDCNHTHDKTDGLGEDANGHVHQPDSKSLDDGPSQGPGYREQVDGSGQDMERTPLLTNNSHSGVPNSQHLNVESRRPNQRNSNPAIPRRPSLQARLKTQMSSLVYGDQSSCYETGSCYGYSNVCGQECYKYAPNRASEGGRNNLHRRGSMPNLARSATAPFAQARQAGRLQDLDEEQGVNQADRPNTDMFRRVLEAGHDEALPESELTGELHGILLQSSHAHFPDPSGKRPDASQDLEQQGKQLHHHHVPKNAFLSIGLQTSIAIALHKLPEGFITYATNHANAQLGFAVFMALFIHNITEGFAMALPLYLAIGSRAKAMFWSSLLGGFSQPLGAGVAALWFALAGKSDMAPGERVYGAMFAITCKIHHRSFCPIYSSHPIYSNRPLKSFIHFLLHTLSVSYYLHPEPESSIRTSCLLTSCSLAIKIPQSFLPRSPSFLSIMKKGHNQLTPSLKAGIMTSVALQLFSESLDLSHNQKICTIFAFLGMALLGFSFALTAS